MIHFYDKYQMVIFLAVIQRPSSHQEWRSYQLEIGCQPLHLTCLACGHQVQVFTWIPSRELTYSLPAGTFESMIFLFPRWNMLVSRRVMVWFVDFLIEILRHVRICFFLQKVRHDRCFCKDKGWFTMWDDFYPCYSCTVDDPICHQILDAAHGKPTMLMAVCWRWFCCQRSLCGSLATCIESWTIVKTTPSGRIGIISITVVTPQSWLILFVGLFS